MATRISNEAKATRAPSLRVERRRHRESLRGQVLDAAATIIDREGADALSMRKLALTLDCAPMTLYSYFGDKHELLLALAHRSFSALAVRLTGEPGDQPLKALRALYLAYAQFGLESPNEYRTIFMTPETQPPRERKGPEQMFAENPAFAAGVERARACVDAGLMSGDPHAIATLLWTAVHGAIAAMLTFPAFPFGSPATYVSRVLDLTIAALRMQPPDPLL